MRGFFSRRFGGSLLVRMIYIRERERKKGIFLGILWLSRAEKRTRVEEEQLQPTLSRYASGYSGCSDHIWFLHFGHLEIFNVLSFGVDGKGHKLFCWDWSFTTPPCFDFDYFMCHWCLWKYRTPCLNVITLGFFCLNPILNSSLRS